MGKIVLGIDNSEHSKKALDYYVQNVRRPDDELILVHSTEVPLQQIERASLSERSAPPSASAMSTEVIHDVISRAQKEAEGVIGTYQHLLNNKGVPFRLATGFGKPGELVVTTAEEEHATMIIVGSRGFGKLKRALLGSVSHYIVNHAHCPVLVARF